ncbi:hypothetical protein ACFL04_01345 [Patescibacteria group bacterium]
MSKNRSSLTNRSIGIVATLAVAIVVVLGVFIARTNSDSRQLETQLTELKQNSIPIVEPVVLADYALSHQLVSFDTVEGDETNEAYLITTMSEVYFPDTPGNRVHVLVPKSNVKFTDAKTTSTGTFMVCPDKSSGVCIVMMNPRAIRPDPGPHGRITTALTSIP